MQGNSIDLCSQHVPSKEVSYMPSFSKQHGKDPSFEPCGQPDGVDCGDSQFR
jgi:hypothetical protein